MKSALKILMLAALLLPTELFAKNIEMDLTASNNTDSVIANVMSENGTEAKVILVDKSAKKMYNVHVMGDTVKIINEFPIMYGANIGDKFIRGDNKTPEGVYYITTYQSRDYLLKRYGNYAKIYGEGSLPLNYPNPIDRLKKKTGSGIWIHGTDPNTDKESTQGCVALRNEDFTSLKDNSSVKYPVIIADNLTYLPMSEYKDLKVKITQRLDGFIKSWGASDYDSFKNYIHENYKSGSTTNAKNYLASKESLMKRYPKRTVITKNVKVLMKDKNYVVFDTEQFYCAANITTMGNKKYYFETAKDGELKLISEEFSQSSPAPIISEEVEKFINGWASAWKNQQITPYMQYYSKSFTDDKVGKYDDWYKYKEEIFSLNNNIDVKISDISWKTNRQGYIVTFIQDYSSDAVKDKGHKTLILQGCPSDFAIISETWKPL